MRGHGGHGCERGGLCGPELLFKVLQLLELKQERSLVNNVFVETDRNNNYHVSQLVNCPKKKTLNTLHVFNSFFLHSNLADISVIYFILIM